MMTLIGDPLYRPFKYRAPNPLPTESPKPSAGRANAVPTL